jgi:hypothetical protein
VSAGGETLAAIFDVDNTLATAMIDRLMHHARGDCHPRRQLPHERQGLRLIPTSPRYGGGPHPSGGPACRSDGSGSPARPSQALAAHEAADPSPGVSPSLLALPSVPSKARFRKQAPSGSRLGQSSRGEHRSR